VAFYYITLKVYVSNDQANGRHYCVHSSHYQKDFSLNATHRFGTELEQKTNQGTDASITPIRF
jgi:hypothetical protein